MFCASGKGLTARFCTRYALRLGAAALAVSALSGCQSIDVNSSNAALVRVFNASPDSQGFDYYVGKTAIVYNVGFGAFNLGYVSLPPGTQTITTDQTSTTQVLAAVNASLGSQKNYTVITSNMAANLQETVFADQNTAAPSGQIAVRVINEATRIGAVDIYLVPSGGKLSTTLPFATGIAFNMNSGYIDIPAATTYSVAVVPTGTTPSSSTTLFNGSQACFTTGCVDTFMVIDTPLTTSPAANAVVLTDFVPATTTG
jgi:hypothetical protein